MAGYVLFPKDGSDLVDALDEAIEAAELERNIHSIDWWITHYYLEGVRKFYIHDWTQGDVRIPYENKKGEIEFRFEYLLSKLPTQVGRFLKMDTGPTALPMDYGLDGVRYAGITKAILSYMTRSLDKGSINAEHVLNLLKYGTSGLYHYRVGGDNIADRTRVQVVPPWELLSIPAELDVHSQAGGIVWKRPCLLSWLKQSKGKSKDNPNGLDLSGSLVDLEATETPYGQAPNGSGPTEYMYGYQGPGSSWSDVTPEKEKWGSVSKADDESVQELKYWVEPELIYLYNEHGLVGREIVKVGNKIAHDTVFEGRGVPCPLRISRFTDTGRFYGRSWVGPMIPFNDRIEKMLETQFQNVTDLDSFGCLVAMSTSGINRRELQKKEKRKVLIAEPDPVSPNREPVYKIDPYNTGDFPGKVANLALQIMNEMSGQGDVYSGQAPGRTDSAAALGFLFETGNVGVVATANSVADAWVGIYASMLSSAKLELGSEEGFKLPVIDEDMIGVSLKVEGNEVSIRDNPIPDPWEIKIEVKDRLPTSSQQRRQEALQMLQMGLLSPVQFEILNYRENLGFPIGSRSNWNAWRKAVYQKVLLFGDGKKPGPFLFDDGSGQSLPINFEADNPDITLIVIQDLMSSPEFMHVSREIRGAFEKWKGLMETQKGQRLPQGLPDPSQLAMMAGGGGMPPGGGGGAQAPGPLG